MIFDDLLSDIPRRLHGALANEYIDWATEYVQFRGSTSEAITHLNTALNRAGARKYSMALDEAAWAAAYTWSLNYGDPDESLEEGYEFAVDEFTRMVRESLAPVSRSRR